ncbi:MAG: DUF6295 family protein [Chloroflexi bacterium]|nr:DUF6295 family protein [Chloroflexota bacterium]
MIVEQAEISGSGKGPNGWFKVDRVNVAFDHPFHLPEAHALSIDFVDAGAGPGARVAVELTAESGRALVQAVLEALERGDRQLGAAPSASVANA